MCPRLASTAIPRGSPPTGVSHDVIRSLNGVRIGAADGIRRAIAGVAEGGKVELAVIRKGDPLLLHGTR